MNDLFIKDVNPEEMLDIVKSMDELEVKKATLISLYMIHRLAFIGCTIISIALFAIFFAIIFTKG